MRLGFIGMSGVGKSYWAGSLAQVGFKSLHCDDMIAAKLRMELGKPFVTLYDMGHWMGFPYEAGYHEREGKYLACEIELLQSIIDNLAQGNTVDNDLVIDLTGSAIYAGPEIFARLRQFVKIVYLAISPQVHEKMLHDYLNQPRPVIWKGLFQREPSEAASAALARCYPQLIRFREELYETYADVKIAYHTHRQAELTVEQFLTHCHNHVKEM